MAKSKLTRLSISPVRVEAARRAFDALAEWFQITDRLSEAGFFPSGVDTPATEFFYRQVDLILDLLGVPSDEEQIMDRRSSYDLLIRNIANYWPCDALNDWHQLLDRAAKDIARARKGGDYKDPLAEHR